MQTYSKGASEPHNRTILFVPIGVRLARSMTVKFPFLPPYERRWLRPRD